METISQAEKLDVLLVLAMAFEKKLGEPAAPAAPAETAAGVAERSFAALVGDETAVIKSRAAFIDRLPDEKRNLWQGLWLDKIRRRGRAIRLDVNINPGHIVNVLGKEPRPVQALILKNLPAELSRRVALVLDADFEAEEAQAEPSAPRPNAEIVALIRQKFLSNFVALEDVYEALDLDKLSVAALDQFIRQLGLRETAIACRGISSKETLAAFVGRFAEEDAKEIAQYIVELESVRPFWVKQADRLVRQVWNNDLMPEDLSRKLGLKLLASAFVRRDAAARRYTAQKLAWRESRRWLGLINESEGEYFSAPEEERALLGKRQKMIERLAAKFGKTGRL